MRLAGKVAIVTGGGKGIGKVYSHGLAAEGASVVVADIDGAAGAATAAAINAAGGQALPIPTDVSDQHSVAALMAATVREYGGLDALVNNAALFAAIPQHPWEDTSVEEWDGVMAVNVRGTFLCCKAAVPLLRERGGGSIINISSTTVLNGGRGSVHYVASKGAVMAMTRSLARLVGDSGIRVNSLAPGGTASETLLEARGESAESFSQSLVAVRCLRRPETPDDLVGTVVFLASDESAFITGQFIAVDGGKDFH